MRTRPQAISGPTRAVIYSRVSSAGQEDNSSLATQEDRCRAYAAERGWMVVGVYREVHSGAELFERPQLAALREAVRQGEADAVVAFALDRVSRNQAHLGFLLSEWDHAGVPLGLVTEELVDTPEGRLLQSVRGFVAEVERMKIRERTSRGLRARVEGGKPMVGSRPPYGYRWEGEKKARLVPEPERALVVRRIFDAALRGESLRGIAKGLTADGVPTPTGRGTVWAASVVYDILTHPTYAGQLSAYRYAKERGPDGRSRVRTRDAMEHVALPAGVVVPLVTPEEQRTILVRLEANKLRAVRNNRDPEATLLRGGFARCGYCGSPLSTRRDGRDGTPGYRCAGTAADRYGCPAFVITAPILDGAVWSRVVEVLRDPEIIAGEVARLGDRQAATANLDSLDRRIAELVKRQAKVARLVTSLDDEDAAAPLVHELRSLAGQKRQLGGERDRLIAQEEVSACDAQRLSDLAAWCERVTANLALLGYDEKRRVLDALAVDVRVWRADHEPRWHLTMSVPDRQPDELVATAA